MDVIANELRKFYNEGIPVLWRPLHEASGGWFWWGAKGSSSYQELWRIMHDRFTNHFGLHNLIWVSTHMEYDWYAGDDLVDVVGLDIYTSPDAPMSAQWEGEQAHFNGRKLIALSESGTIPVPQNMIDYGTWWSWFSLWNGEFLREVGDAKLTTIYQDTLVTTADELPEWSWEIPVPLDPFEVTDPGELPEYAPVAYGVTFTGDLLVGSVLTGSYTYSDPEGVSEGASRYAWYLASNASGSDKVAIDGANGISYIVDDSLEEKYVAFGIAPVRVAGVGDPREGEQVISEFRKLWATGILNSGESAVHIYPNPFRESLYVKNAGPYETLTILNVQGIVLQHVEVLGRDMIELNLGWEKRGIYLIRLSHPDGSMKLILLAKQQ